MNLIVEWFRKGTFKEFEGLISTEANSDNESLNGHICSDCDNIGKSHLTAI